MKRVFKRLDYLTGLGIKTLFLILNSYFITFALLQFCSELQKPETNTLVITLGLCLAFSLVNLFLLLGCLSGWIVGSTFEAAPRAMLQLQVSWTTVKFFALIPQILTTVRLFTSPLYEEKNQYEHYIFIKVVSLSHLPYELYPQSCILLE